MNDTAEKGKDCQDIVSTCREIIASMPDWKQIALASVVGFTIAADAQCAVHGSTRTKAGDIIS